MKIQEISEMEFILKSRRFHVRIPISPYGLCAAGIILLGVGIRIALIAAGWPHTNSDEGTYGMMGIDIAFHGARPIYMYGQLYMGTTQAYLAAFFFRLFGVSMFDLRLGLVALFALFLVAMYWLASLLYSKGLALLTLFVLILGWSYMYYRQLQAVGGWVETLFFGALFYALASWLALTAQAARQEPSAKRRGLRLAAFFGWGLLVGLSLWSNIVVAPFILTSSLLLLIFCRKEIRSWSPVALIIGLLVGGFPLILYNLHATLATNSLATTLGIFGGGVSGHSRLYFLAHGALGVLLLGLPAISGDSSMCSASQTLFFGGSGPLALQCTLSQGLWSLAWIALWIVSFGLAVKIVMGAAHNTEREQRELARSAARLGLLCAAAIALILFAFSSSSTYTPYLSSRYIIFIWIATPALLYPLWLSASARLHHGRGSHAIDADGPRVGADVSRIPRPEIAIRYGKLLAVSAARLALLALILFLLWGTVKTFQEIPGVQAGYAQQADLIHNLKRIGAVHIYSDYWTCDSIIFQSDEQIICDTLDANLNQGYVRYPPDAAIVQADPRASYVFPANLPQAQTIAQRAARSANHYRRYKFDGYVVYQPDKSSSQTSQYSVLSMVEQPENPIVFAARLISYGRYDRASFSDARRPERGQH
jgi:hypothetical protein